MADNVILRIIRMILDKDSAKQTQNDANQLASGIDNAFKNMAQRVAGYLGVAFLIGKIKAFGQAAIKEAMESQAAWANLKGTVDATGASFDKMEGKIRAAADAFQDATIHDDDAFAETMARMVTLTGDANASLNNMGLVANVAAQFFKGELEPAANLVAKAMNGNTNALKKMGIEAKDAQQALEILAQRSMGAATREASTFAGQLKQTDELWKDFLKATGEAIISSDGAASGVTVLREAIKTLTDWVVANKDKIREWVKNGIAFAIDAADVFIRAVWGMGAALTGGFQTALGVAAKGVAFLVKGLEGVARVSAVLDAVLGNTDAMVSDLADADTLHKQADAINDWADAAINAGSEKVKKGIDVLSTPLFSSDQFKGPPPKPGELQVNKPMVGKNMFGDNEKEVQKALEDFQKATRAAANMEKILGDQFDATGAEIDRTTKLLNVLAGNGIDPASVGMAGLKDRLHDLVTNIKPVEDVTKALAKSLKEDATLGALTAADAIKKYKDEQDDLQKQINQLIAQGIDPQSEKIKVLTDRWAALQRTINSVTAGTKVDQLKKQQDDILNAIKTLLDQGVSPTSDAITDLMDRYNKLTDRIGDAEKIQHLADIFKELGDSVEADKWLATLESTTTKMDILEIEQKALQKAMQQLIAAGIKPTDKAFQDLEARYAKVSKAIEKQTELMKLQAEVADVLAEAVGAAILGGFHDAAVQKAKQNAIEAIEWAVRAGAFALLGRPDAASAAIKTAGQFAAVAAMWGALAAGTGGFGSSGGGEANASGGAGSDLSGSRSSSANAANNAEQPKPDVTINLIGPGFNALNPKVQEVVWGAQQMAEQRYGPNAKVRIRPMSQNGQ